MIFLCYPKCTTCQKAKKCPNSNGVVYEERHIKDNHPTEEELRRKVKRPLLIALSTILVLNILVLFGCTKPPVTPSTTASEMPTETAATTSASSSWSVQESSTTVTSAATVPSIEESAIIFVDPYIDEAIALIDADRRQYSDVAFGYEPKPLYDGLHQEEKAMYDEMLGNVQQLEPCSYIAAQHGYEVLEMAMAVSHAIITDHPELEIYFMIREVVEGNMTTALEALYFMPWDAKQHPADLATLREEILRFDAVCNRITERMPDDFSTYDKYRYLAVVISLITSYDYDGIGGWQVGTAYGSIMGGHSICQGYSRGFMYLCQKANLWCETVDGVAGDNAAHMWNIVKLDSGTYFVDITWCDTLGLPGSPEWSNYFMLTQDEILVDHEITDGKVATGTAIN